MTLGRFRDYKAPSAPFLLDGLVCPTLTLLTGKPKAGKSLLAGHIARGLITGDGMDGRATDGRDHVVYWAGMDAGWRSELTDRWGGTTWFEQMLYDEPPAEPRSFCATEWADRGQELEGCGVTVAVIDNLYGLAQGRNLDHAHEVMPLFAALRNWTDRGIAVVVLAHAGKHFSNSGPAHSYAIEAEARHTLKLSRRGQRTTLTIGGNSVAESKLLLNLTLDRCTATTGDATDKGEQKRARERASRDAEVSQLFSGANDEDRESQTALGRRAAALGLSKNDAAGRTRIRNLIERGLIAPGPAGLLEPAGEATG